MFKNKMEDKKKSNQSKNYLISINDFADVIYVTYNINNRYILENYHKDGDDDSEEIYFKIKHYFAEILKDCPYANWDINFNTIYNYDEKYGVILTTCISYDDIKISVSLSGDTSKIKPIYNELQDKLNSQKRVLKRY